MLAHVRRQGVPSSKSEKIPGGLLTPRTIRC
jgi:hypothetical protein